MCNDPFISDALTVLQQDIARCRICEDFAPDFAKPAAMDRGLSGRIMVVGRGPGKTELTEGRAFSGQSGKRLDEWLVACGCEPTAPRRNIYCTSITKCYTSDSTKIHRMAGHCAKFLQRQLELIRPELVITLGTTAYEELAIDTTPVCDAWCRLFDSRTRFPLMPAEDQFRILVWPHPSPLNRWLNSEANHAKLRDTFEHVKRVIGDSE